MSNFICSECGMTNIDCGRAGYKTPKEIKLEKENKCLQEQILEANKLILWCARISWTGDQREDIFDKYLAKWGVK